MLRDVGAAEELAQDALVTALETWPTSGVPENPGAWLMTTATNRAKNTLSRRSLANHKHEEVARDLEDIESRDPAPALNAALDDDVRDDLLRLVLTACHPILSSDAQLALTLRLLCGLTTEEIARAFLVPEPTIAQRIVRAKRALADAKVPFELVRKDELATRLPSVLGVVYLIFNEGYVATSGGDWMRPALCEEALRLARILVGLLPDEPEVHGLVALMELVFARNAARISEAGEPILLADQNRSRWDLLLVRRGLVALERAESLAAASNRNRDAYTLQAAIAACHARARTLDETDWARIASLYGELSIVTRSPVVELNRAVAVAMADGPGAGLAILIGLDRILDGYHLLDAARGDLLEKLGRLKEARDSFERAASLTKNEREKNVLLARASHCASKL
jgi:RNA polymerase sigma-70 factor (ECF subfamily)